MVGIDFAKHNINIPKLLWNSLAFSLVAQKMKMLLKINDQFAITPLIRPLGWLSSLNSTINTFHWRGKRPRIKNNNTAKTQTIWYVCVILRFLPLLPLSPATQHLSAWLDDEQMACAIRPIQHVAFVDK